MLSGTDSEAVRGAWGSAEPHFDSKFWKHLNLGCGIYPEWSHLLLFT